MCGQSSHAKRPWTKFRARCETTASQGSFDTLHSLVHLRLANCEGHQSWSMLHFDVTDTDFSCFRGSPTNTTRSLYVALTWRCFVDGLGFYFLGPCFRALSWPWTTVSPEHLSPSTAAIAMTSSGLRPSWPNDMSQFAMISSIFLLWMPLQLQWKLKTYVSLILLLLTPPRACVSTKGRPLSAPFGRSSQARGFDHSIDHRSCRSCSCPESPDLLPPGLSLSHPSEDGEIYLLGLLVLGAAVVSLLIIPSCVALVSERLLIPLAAPDVLVLDSVDLEEGGESLAELRPPAGPGSGCLDHSPASHWLAHSANVLSTESTSKSFPQRRRCWSPRLAWLNHLVQVWQWTRSHWSYHGFFFSPFTPEWVPHFLGFLIARWWSLHLLTHSLSTCQCHRSSSAQQVVHLGLITLVERGLSRWRTYEKNHHDLFNLTPAALSFSWSKEGFSHRSWLRCTFSFSTSFSAWFLL